MSGRSVPAVTRLEEVLRRHDVLWTAFCRLADLGLHDWYLGAGCIAQSVWNDAHGRPPDEGILDFDLVYFNTDISVEAEQAAEGKASALLADLGVALDVKNQARVHLWYRERFGYDIRPYVSAEDAIATWPTTATAVGVRLLDGHLHVCAPYGLDDLFALVVRANRVQITQAIYQAKADRWCHQWPRLVVLPWEEGLGIEGSRRIQMSSS
jgi:uncharacterized protein